MSMIRISFRVRRTTNPAGARARVMRGWNRQGHGGHLRPIRELLRSSPMLRKRTIRRIYMPSCLLIFRMVDLRAARSLGAAIGHRGTQMQHSLLLSRIDGKRWRVERQMAMSRCRVFASSAGARCGPLSFGLVVRLIASLRGVVDAYTVAQAVSRFAMTARITSEVDPRMVSISAYVVGGRSTVGPGASRAVSDLRQLMIVARTGSSCRDRSFTTALACYGLDATCTYRSPHLHLDICSLIQSQ